MMDLEKEKKVCVGVQCVCVKRPLEMRQRRWVDGD